MSGIEVAFSGKLAKPAEIKMVKNGELRLVTLTIAVMIPKQDKPQWIRTAVFGDLSAGLDALPAGATVYIEGSLKLDTWTATDGTPKSGLSAVASAVQRLAQIGRQRPAQLEQHRGAA